MSDEKRLTYYVQNYNRAPSKKELAMETRTMTGWWVDYQNGSATCHVPEAGNMALAELNRDSAVRLPCACGKPSYWDTSSPQCKECYEKESRERYEALPKVAAESEMFLGDTFCSDIDDVVHEIEYLLQDDDLPLEEVEAFVQKLEIYPAKPVDFAGRIRNYFSASTIEERVFSDCYNGDEGAHWSASVDECRELEEKLKAACEQALTMLPRWFTPDTTRRIDPQAIVDLMVENEAYRDV